MPRKIRGQPDLAQNRLSQRQCRARKKEYVAALEARLREYEATEVQASLDMQRAARAVAWENERLLMLLARHGVSRPEIDAFLQLPDGHINTASSSPGPKLPEVPASRTVSAFRPDQSTSSHDSPLKKRDEQAITTCNSTLDEGHGSYTPTDERSNSRSTSCDTAATIIADLQGHGDAMQAREVLGCGSAENCHVENTRLFQLIDETA